MIDCVVCLLSAVVKVWKLMRTVQTKQVAKCVSTRSNLLGKTIPFPWKSLDEGKQPSSLGIEEQRRDCS
jgi:hypothetical protein